LVACEFSGRVRDAFIRHGCDAISCDLLPTEVPGPHIQGDVLPVLRERWDLVVAHPPCTMLASSSAGWMRGRLPQIEAAAEFFRSCLWANAPHVVVENPVGLATRLVRPPDQYIEPWHHGHGETKKTGLWLVGLPLLKATDVVIGRRPSCWLESPGVDRWKNRSRTYPGIAEALASQYAPVLL
jgi:hypothetical protein